MALKKRSQLKTEQVQVMVSKALKKAVKEKAEAAGLTISEFSRMLMEREVANDKQLA